jgi:hypothetical protein
MSALYKAPGVKERFASRLVGLQGSVEEIANTVRNGDTFLHMPPPSASTPPRTAPGFPQRPPQTIAEPESKIDSPDDLGDAPTSRPKIALPNDLESLKDVLRTAGVSMGLASAFHSMINSAKSASNIKTFVADWVTGRLPCKPFWRLARLGSQLSR